MPKRRPSTGFTVRSEQLMNTYHIVSVDISGLTDRLYDVTFHRFD